MTLRKVPGALALGLLASLVAHAALFGGDHAMGGHLHLLLLQGALAGVLSLLIFFGSVAWSTPGGADGSVLTARLRERLPNFAAVATAAVLWYAAAESLEPHHAAPLAGLVFCTLGAAAWLIRRLAEAVADAFAAAVLAVLGSPFSPRLPRWNRRRRRALLFRSARLQCRRLARPPPIASLLSA